MEPRFLVIHFTAGRDAQSSVDWFLNPDARASAHLVIGRDGSITQLVPFDRVAWHAGRSSWNGLSGLNRFSIGIELDNAGKLTRQGGRWTAWFGRSYDDSDVMEAIHPNETELAGWHVYTEKQLETAVEVSGVLIKKYNLDYVLGHEEISPGRKVDPGPAFPLRSVRARLLGRRDDSPEILETSTVLNIRTGPGTQFDTLPGSPLPAGTRVEILGAAGSWRRADVVGIVNGIMDIQGWVHGGYLRPVS